MEALLADLADAADDDVFDGGRVNSAATDQRVEDRSPEVRRVPFPKRASTAASGRAQRFDDIGVGHSSSPLCGLLGRPGQYEPALAHQRPCRALVNQCAFSRLHNSYRAVDRKELDIAHPRRKFGRLAHAPGNSEMRTVDQQLAGVTHLRVEVIVVRARIDNVGRFVEVKLARPAIIVKPIRKVDRLLDFEHGQAGPKRVDRAGRIIDEIALFRPFPIHQIDDRSVPSGAHQLIGLNFTTRSDAQFCIIACIEHDPAFILAARIAALPGGRIIGMDLDRQSLGREQIFGHDVEFAARRRLEPDLANLSIGFDSEPGINAPPAPRLIDNLCSELFQAVSQSNA